MPALIEGLFLLKSKNGSYRVATPFMLRNTQHTRSFEVITPLGASPFVPSAKLMTDLSAAVPVVAERLQGANDRF